MMIRRAATVALLSVGWWAATGCATAPSSTDKATPARDLTASDFYPFNPGWAWAYDLEKDGQRILAVYKLIDRTAETATIQAGEDRLTYAISPEGIAQQDGGMAGDFVIKNPVAAGSQWAVAGGTAKIVSVGQEVTVEAGKFPDCAVVEVTRADPVRVARTTFAPGVGPIQIEVSVQVGGSFATVMRATLRAVTKPGQDPLGG